MMPPRWGSNAIRFAGYKDAAPLGFLDGYWGDRHHREIGLLCVALTLAGEDRAPPAS